MEIVRTFGKEYTTGVLTIEGRKEKLMTLELPFKSNQNDISCIPNGKYLFKRYTSTKFPNTFKLYSLGESEILKHPDYHYERTDILIHKGNYLSNTHGCILVGMEYSNGLLGNCSKALDILNSIFTENNKFYPLLIKGNRRDF
jgi:hypothetical protein